MGIILPDKKVSFCSVTKPEGHKNGKHMVAIFVDKKEKKAVIKEAERIWEENKSGKAKKAEHDASEWFVKDDDGNLVLFLTAKAETDYPIKFTQGKGCSFTEEDFSIIGAGSIIDIEFGMFHYTKDGKEGMGRGISGICLKELVKYEGGSQIGGEAIERKAKKDKDSDEVPEKKKSKKDKDEKSDKKDKGEKSDKKDKKKKSKKD